MAGRRCTGDDLTPGFGALVAGVERAVAAHRPDSATVSLICHGKPGDLIEIDVPPYAGGYVGRPPSRSTGER